MAVSGLAAEAIGVYRTIQERQIDNDHKLAEWAFRNCDNPYIPFGDSYLGRRTIIDYLIYKEKNFANIFSFFGIRLSKRGRW